MFHNDFDCGINDEDEIMFFSKISNTAIGNYDLHRSFTWCALTTSLVVSSDTMCRLRKENMIFTWTTSFLPVVAPAILCKLLVREEACHTPMQLVVYREQSRRQSSGKIRQTILLMQLPRLISWKVCAIKCNVIYESWNCLCSSLNPSICIKRTKIWNDSWWIIIWINSHLSTCQKW